MSDSYVRCVLKFALDAERQRLHMRGVPAR